MLIANVEPIQYFNETAVQLGGNIMFYDMKAQNCTMQWYLFDSGPSVIFTAVWNIPADVLSGWGNDDTYLLQALANEKEYIITSFE